MNKSSSVSFNNTAKAFQDKSNFELFKAYCLFFSMNKPVFTKIGTFSIKFLLENHFPVKFFIKPTLFKQFCGGETLEESQKVIQKLWKSNIGSILDYSVEGESNEKGFEKTTSEILLNIDLAAQNEAIPFCVFKLTGISSSVLLEKIQRGAALTSDETAAYQNLLNRLQLIARQAHQKQVRILIDAEESWIQNAIDQLTYQLMEQYNRETAIIFNTLQMYRHDRLRHLEEKIKTASEKGFIAAFKLVRGAYMEKERTYSKTNQSDDPIHPDKQATDQAFDDAVKLCIKNIKQLTLCMGSHNEESNLLLTTLMQENGLTKNDKRIFFAQLYGMSDHISYNLSSEGYNVAKYVPYGPVEKVMPYLFRRAQENTSVTGQSSRELSLLRIEKKRRGI